jgi:[acyl-carrier-protein] S-malonyltransferase
MTKVKKIALVFSGQGAQYPGMGKSLYDSSPATKAVFDEAGDWIKDKCFEGTVDELRETSTTQPAVYTVDMAAFAALKEKLDCRATLAMTNRDNTVSTATERDNTVSTATDNGNAVSHAASNDNAIFDTRHCEERSDEAIQISAVAGFSLGEYAAFTAAGIIPDVKAGFDLVCRRSALMAEVGRYPDGSPRGVMAAVLGDKDDILALVEVSRGNDVLEAVNFNSANQTVIAGDSAAVTRFSANAKNSGKKLRAIPLAVSTAFHSPIMEPAANGIADAVKGLEFGNALYPVYLNLTGGRLDFAEGLDPASNAGTGFQEDYSGVIRSILAAQVKSPVYWQKTIENIVAAGVDAIIELGPGKTLTGLNKKNAPGILALHVEDEESLNKTIAALS